MNEKTLRGSLQYACRESRPEGMPRLKALYVFSPVDKPPAPTRPQQDSRSPSPESPGAVRSPKALPAGPTERPAAEEPEPWYVRRGEQFAGRIDPEWASTLVACAGVISFDSVLCTGPRHFNSSGWGTVNIEALDAASSAASPSTANFSVATHSLGGCASCGAAPEGWTVWGEEVYASSKRDADGRRTSESCMADLARFPLLAPPPMHSASLRVAMCPTGQTIRSRLPFVQVGKQKVARFIPRCFDCIRDRYCVGCHKWWCESCYLGPRAVSPAGHAGSNSGPDSVSKFPSCISSTVVSESVGSVGQAGVCTEKLA